MTSTNIRDIHVRGQYGVQLLQAATGISRLGPNEEPRIVVNNGGGVIPEPVDKSKLVAEDDQYLRQLFGYIHLNPLDIKFPDWEKEKRRASSDMRFFLEGYRYSSYLEYRGKKRPESAILSIKAFPSYFKNIKEYTDFINSYFLNT